MDTEFEHGYDLIKEIIKHQDKKDLFNVYFCASENNINTNYKTFGEYVDAMRPKTPKQNVKEKSAEDIFESIRKDIARTFQKSEVD